MTAPAGAPRVAVVGAGPVGVTAANLLGLYGVSTLVLDRETDVVDYPRAVGVDDEALRTFQAIGVVDEVLRKTIQNVPLRLFDGRGRLLAEVQPSARLYGWYRRNIFMQPWTEQVLRAGLDRFDHVRLLLGHELEALEQDRDGVLLRTRDLRGVAHDHRVDLVIGADGGRSTVRRLVGIALEGTTHERQWVVVDAVNDPLDAPFTGLHADPARPFVCAHLPDDHRRWEFMLFPGEDPEEFCRPERITELLRRHVADPSGIEVVRARAYTHHSRVAERFVDGRVVLAGDAAHLMPPWVGQGMNTGLRDAANLAWKVAAIVHGEADLSLLETYERERRPHARAMVDLSTTMGRVLCPTGRATAAVRDVAFRAASAAPALKRWMVEMRFKPMPDHRDGFAAPPPDPRRPTPTGRLFVQHAVETLDGRRVRLDDVLGDWFALVGLECDPLAGLDATAVRALARFRPTIVKIVESRAGERWRTAPCKDPATRVVEDVDNELRRWFLGQGTRVVLVRPDRYVAAEGPPDLLGRLLVDLAARYAGKVPAC